MTVGSYFTTKFFNASFYVFVLILSSVIGMILQESYPGFKGDNMPKRVQRIVNGTEIIPNSWPYLVYLYIGGSICGGTVLDEYTIMTAAHCFNKYNGYDEAYVLAGAHSITIAEYEDSDVQKISFFQEDITVHEHYDINTLENDIAILNLQQPLNMTSGNVQYLTVNINASCPAVGDSCSVAGWGVTATNGDTSDVPLEVDIKVVENYTCELEFTPSLILAGGEEGKDSCQGDSGGPFVCSCGGQLTLSGIVSHGRNFCAEAGCPGAYTRVTAYLDWIKENRIYLCSGLNQCGSTVDREIKVTTQTHGPASDSGHVLTIFSLLNVIFMLTTSIFVQA